MEKRLLRVGEAAAVLSVSRWTIYRWVECGRLRGTQLGKGSLRIFRESLTDLIQHHEIAMNTTLPSSNRP
ncbi:MAG: helix-turn-helix domain-containing protein [Nitrospira sp.]|nr:MAG: helix-turn-helix domain-containing protein [Nitrospira sp.]